MSSSAATASAFSIFAITWAVEPDASISVFSACDVGRRADERERDEVDAERRARTRGRRCPCASATGSAAARPGRLTPLCELTVAADEDLAARRGRGRPRRRAAGRRRRRSARRARAGGPSRARPARPGGRRPARRPRPAIVTSSPRSSSTGAASSPMRSFGPCRSAISATGRPTSSCASRIALAPRRRGRRACRARS